MTPAPLPPLADGLPLIGSTLALLKDFEGFMYQQYAKHGSCFRVKVPNGGFVVFAGPAAADALNQNNGELDAWRVWENIIGEFGGHKTLGMLEGEEHRRYRAAARSGLSKTQAQQNIPLLVQITEEALANIPVGQTFSVAGVMQNLVADCVGMLTLGRKPEQHLAAFIEYWHTQLAVNIAQTTSDKVLTTAKYLAAKKEAKEAAQAILDLDENSLPSPYVKDLKKFMNENPEMMNDEELLFMMVLPYIAGLDTVANVLTLALYRIYSDTKLLKRLQEEIEPMMKAGLNPKDLRKMKVLHALVLEVMRYYPIANMFARYSVKDFEFHGYHIGKGQRVLMALMASQRDSKFFAEPDKFDVDRFLEPRNEHRQRGAMSPYGAGAHTCLGAGMAEVLLAVLLATMVSNGCLALFPAGYRMKAFHSRDLLPDPNFRLVKLA